MKAKRLFLAMAMVVFAIGSVSAEEKNAVKKFNEDGTVNEAMLTKEELRWVRLEDTKPEYLITARDKVDRLRLILLDCDTYYTAEDGLMYTKLTRKEVVNQGFPEFVYDMIQNRITIWNKDMSNLIKKYGKGMIPKIIEAWKVADDKYFNEKRPKLVAEMNAALKQAEAEKAK